MLDISIIGEILDSYKFISRINSYVLKRMGFASSKLDHLQKCCVMRPSCSLGGPSSMKYRLINRSPKCQYILFCRYPSTPQLYLRFSGTESHSSTFRYLRREAYISKILMFALICSFYYGMWYLE